MGEFGGKKGRTSRTKNGQRTGVLDPRNEDPNTLIGGQPIFNPSLHMTLGGGGACPCEVKTKPGVTVLAVQFLFHFHEIVRPI